MLLSLVKNARFCFIASLITAFYSIAWAEEPNTGIKVVKTANDLILTGETCPILLKQAKALAAWKNATATNEPTATPPRLCAGIDKASAVSVGKLVPKWVLEHQDVHPAFDGPNCWATSSYNTHITPSLIYLAPEEFNFHMIHETQCILKTYEERKPGDLIALRSPNAADPQGYDEVHGFIYLTDQLTYSKNGMYRNSTFSIQSYPEVLKLYGVSEHCEKTPDATCAIYAQFLHCGGALPVPKNIGTDDLAKYSDFSKEVAGLMNFAISGHALERDLIALHQLKNELADTSAYALKMLNASSDDPDLKAFWGQFYTRTLSVTAQLSVIDLPAVGTNATYFTSKRPWVESIENRLIPTQTH